MTNIFKKPTAYNKPQVVIIDDKRIAVWKEKTFTYYGTKGLDSYRISVINKDTGENIFRTDSADWNHISNHAESYALKSK